MGAPTGPPAPDPDRPLRVARAGGLVAPGGRLLVLLSGGADSVCMLEVALELGAEVSALHVNHGLREDAGRDEQHCRRLCERLGVPLAVERVELAARSGAGNLQAEARDARYALAERHARDDYATGHTASDQAETVLYRLAASPGRRALLGMEARRGRLVRPLLEATRLDTRARCAERGLAYLDDRSNEDPRFARARVRGELLPALVRVAPAAERTVAETSLLLRDEAEVLDRAVEEALERIGRRAVRVEDLRELPRGLARLVLRTLVEEAAGKPRPLPRAELDAVLRLAAGGGSRSLDLGDGLRAIVEYGTLRLTRTSDAPAPPSVRLPVPGAARFGGWEVTARLGEPGEATLSARRLGVAVTVRGWQDGDRMRPAGLGGSKSLQDLFTDRKVPRSLRRSLPVVEANGEIAWVAGLAVGEGFGADPGSPAAEQVGLAARRGA